MGIKIRISSVVRSCGYGTLKTACGYRFTRLPRWADVHETAQLSGDARCICAARKIERVDYVHSDVPGYELHLQRGAAGLLGARCIRTILLEACFEHFYERQPTRSQLYDRTATCGYRFVWMQALYFDAKPYPRSGCAVFTAGPLGHSA